MISPGEDSYDVVFDYIEKRGNVGCIEHGATCYLWTDLSIGCALCFKDVMKKREAENLDEELRKLTGD